MSTSGREALAPVERSREQGGEVAGLVVAVDRREDELDRPLRRKAFGFERIREPEPADHQVRRRGAAAVRAGVRRPGLRTASCRPAAAQARRPCAGDAGTACRPRPSVMPSSRDRKRASGSSSCESGKKNTLRPASIARRDASDATARARGAATVASKRSAATSNVFAAACSQAVVPSAPSGNGAPMRPAPRSSSARAVSARNGCASR